MLSTLPVIGQEEYYSNYNYTHGLELTEVKHFQSDFSGSIWLAGNGGLATYDGHLFKHYYPSPNDPHAIPGSFISDISITSHQEVIVAFDYDGIGIYLPETDNFKIISESDGRLFKDLAAHCLFPVGDSLILIGTKGGLYKWNRKDNIAKKTSFVNAVHDITISKINSNIIYLGGDGLWQLDVSNNQFIKLNSTEIFQLISDEKGELWATDYYTNLINYNPEDSSFASIRILDYDHEPSQGLIKHDNELWIGKDDGIRIYDLKKDNWRQIKAQNSSIHALNGNSIFGIYQDENESVWIGTETGVSCINKAKQSFKILRNNGHLPYTNASKDDNGNYYFTAFFDNKIIKWDSQLSQQQLFDFNGSLFELDGIIDVFIANKIKLILSKNGLYNWKESESRITPFANGKFDKYTGHKFYWNNSSKISFLPPQSTTIYTLDVINNSLDSMAFDAESSELKIADFTRHDGFFWMLSQNGIIKLNPLNNQITNFSFQDTLRNRYDFEYDQFQINGKDVWLLKKRKSVCKGQLIHGKIQITDTYSRENGLGGSRPTKLVINDAGDCFLASLNGVSVYNEKENVFINYNKQDGLIDDALTFGMKLIDGKLFLFGNRTHYVDQNEITELAESPLVKIISLKSQNKSIENSEDISLPYRQNEIEIHFSTNQLQYANSIVTRFRLNEKEEWSYLEKGTNSLIFNDLKYGKYCLEICAKNKFSEWGEASKIKFTIQSPFWFQAWFIGLSFVLLTFLISVIFKIREKSKIRVFQLESQLAELENKALRAQMNPHFIFNCLNSIKSFIIREEKEIAADYITDFAELIRLILSNSREKYIPLSREIEALQLYLNIENQRLNDKFDVKWQIDPDLNTGKVYIQALVLQPFIENAIWHGFSGIQKTGLITIKIDSIAEHLSVVIEDNGIGRKASQLLNKNHSSQKSYGIMITKERLYGDLSHNSKNGIEIEDIEDGSGNILGTRVTLKIKKRFNIN